MPKLPEVKINGELPSSIVYAPAGKHLIHCTVGNVGKWLHTDINSDCIAALNADLKAKQAGSVQPLGYFDHQRGAKAFEVKSFAWDDNKGVVMDIEWTAAGSKAVKGGDYTHVSPKFVFDAKGQIKGLSKDSAEVASLVNEPAFTKIPPVLTASQATEYEGLQVLTASAAIDGMDSVANNQLLPTQPKSLIMNKVAKALGLPEDASEEQILAKIGEMKNKKPEPPKPAPADKKELEAAKDELEKEKKEKEALASKVTELEKEKETLAEASAASFIEAACAAGKIAPKDEATCSNWKTIYMQNPQAAQAAMNGMQASKETTLTASKGNAVEGAQGQSEADLESNFI